jgi:hypothetical protein
MQTNKKVRSANGVVISIDGKVVGLAQSCSMHDDYSPEAASGIGSINPEEHVPTQSRLSISLTQMQLRTGSLRQAGILPENSDDVLAGVVFDITALDKDDGTVLRKYTGCTYSGGSLDIQKHQIVSTSANFLALRVSGTGG